MTPQLKALAEKMARERYSSEHMDCWLIGRDGFIAGFEARDGMDDRLREEHAEMLDELRWIRNNAGEDRIMNICDSLITKIESKNTNNI